jgi:hypothetical protein
MRYLILLILFFSCSTYTDPTGYNQIVDKWVEPYCVIPYTNGILEDHIDYVFKVEIFEKTSSYIRLAYPTKEEYSQLDVMDTINIENYSLFDLNNIFISNK